MSATYHPGTGTLQVFATHQKRPSRRTVYCTAQIDGYYMIGTARAKARDSRNYEPWRFIAHAETSLWTLHPQAVELVRRDSEHYNQIRQCCHALRYCTT